MSDYRTHYRRIGRLAFPLLLGQIGNIAVGFADNIMVGHYSTAALASASFVNNVFNIAIFCCLGFTYGLTPLIGALYTRGEHEGIGRMMRTALRVNLIFTLIVTGLMCALYFNLHLLGQPEELLPLIRPYYLIALAGMIPMMIFNMFAQWSFGINDTGLPTWIMLAANGLNIAGNYVLIFGHFGCPELGLTGAGFSTLGARVLCAVALLYFFFFTDKGKSYRGGFARGKRVAGQWKVIMATGFPVAMQMTFETTSFSGSAVFAGWLGEVPLAAFQIVAISGMLGFCIYYSIGGAMAIEVSHAAGENDAAGMRRSAYAGYHLVLASMVLVSILFITAGRHIMGLFSEDSKVIGLAVTIIVPMVLYQFGDATQITFANALRGTSKVMPMLYIAFVSYIIVGLPLAYVFGFPLHMELYGIVLSFSVCLLLAGALYYAFFLRATRVSALPGKRLS